MHITLMTPAPVAEGSRTQEFCIRISSQLQPETVRCEHMFERHCLDFLNLFTRASSHLTDVGIIVYENLSFHA